MTEFESIPVGIVGGGLAGLAAAARLYEHGFRVDLFEARGRLGGRATAFHDAETGRWIDNCQHVSLGCCTEFADFCRRTGADRLLDTFETLYFFGPDGQRCDLRAVDWLPAPLHLASSLWRLRYLSPGERIGIARGLLALARIRPTGRTARGGKTANRPADVAEPTAGAWLRAQGQSERAIRCFWSVVIVSALAESIDRVSLDAARQVFVEGFMRTRRGYVVSLPRGTLHDFYQQISQWLVEREVAIHLHSPIDRITQGNEDAVQGIRLKDGTRRDFDFTIVAVPWRRAGALLGDALVARVPALSQSGELESSPITSVHLWFDRPITDLPHAVIVDRLSQWLFRRDESNAGAADEFYYQVVISASRSLLGRDREAVVDEVLEDLRALWPAARDAQLLRWRMVTEAHAVFAPTPNSDAWRPTQATPLANLMLAGDWTQTGWPATMEGAVRSGNAAAQAVIDHVRARGAANSLAKAGTLHPHRAGS